jgi:alpha-mannosidase
VRVSGVNTARDHRLRVVLATGVAEAEVWADAAFGVVRRKAPPIVPPNDAMREQPLPTAPLHRYVTVANASTGTTVFSDGSTEYEALPDGSIAVTMFRAVGELSRPDLPERPGHAGWPAETPEAQCLGPFDAGLAVLLHGPRTDAVIDRIERTADDVLFPLAGDTVRQLLTPPVTRGGVALDGDGLAFGACKRSDDGAWMVLRCVNLLERAVEGSWHLAAPIAGAHRARLDETPGDPLPVDGHQVRFVAGPRAAVTVLIR